MTLLFNLKTQKQIRKNLRKQEVESEKILWWKLRNRQLGDYKFRRQFGINKYIVDFYCPKLKLAIEIDGATHSTKKEKVENRFCRIDLRINPGMPDPDPSISIHPNPLVGNDKRKILGYLSSN